MSKSFWCVGWLIDGGKGSRTSCEFGSEDTAIDWADGLQKAGAKGIVVTELIVGRTIKFKSSDDSIINFSPKSETLPCTSAPKRAS